MQHFSVWEDRGQRIRNPALVIEADGVYDQRVALPLTNRVPFPCGVEVLGMSSAIQEDLPIVCRVDLIEDHKQGGSLDHFVYVDDAEQANHVRQASRTR